MTKTAGEEEEEGGGETCSDYDTNTDTVCEETERECARRDDTGDVPPPTETDDAEVSDKVEEDVDEWNINDDEEVTGEEEQQQEDADKGDEKHELVSKKSVRFTDETAPLTTVSIVRSAPMGAADERTALLRRLELETDTATASNITNELSDFGDLSHERSMTNIFMNDRTRKTVSPLLAAINLLEAIEDSRDTHGSFSLEDVRLLKSLLMADNADHNIFYPIKKQSLSKRHLMRVTETSLQLNAAQKPMVLEAADEDDDPDADVFYDAECDTVLDGGDEITYDEKCLTYTEETTSVMAEVVSRAATHKTASRRSTSTTSTDEGFDSDDDDDDDDDDNHDIIIDAFTDRYPIRRPRSFARNSAQHKLTMSTRVITKTVSWKRRAESRRIKEDVLATIEALDRDTMGFRGGAFQSTSMRKLASFDTVQKWKKMARDALFVYRVEAQMESESSSSKSAARTASSSSSSSSSSTSGPVAYPSIGHLRLYLRYLLPGVEKCIESDDDSNDNDITATVGDERNDTHEDDGERDKNEKAAVAEEMEKAVVKETNIERLSKLLQTCDRIDWKYDIFELEALTHGHGLSTLVFIVFEKSGLVRHYGISARRLRDFALEVERRMTVNENGYHNEKHVGCVVQALFSQLSHGCGCLFTHPIERLALLFAATCHDLDHPGLSNDFLIKSGHDWAILYNDRSVLENHHATAAFMLLRSSFHRKVVESGVDSGSGSNKAEAATSNTTNLLGNVLTVEDFRRFRNIVLETILSTDMRSHFSIMGNVQVLVMRYEKERERERTYVSHERTFMDESANDQGLWPLVKEKMTDGNDVLTLMKLAMKVCDLSHLTLRRDLHLRWVDGLQEEFHKQGDKEKALGLPVSFMMDRQKSEMMDAQPGFFEGFGVGLYSTYQEVFGPRAGKYLVSQLQRNLRYWKRRAKEEKRSASSNSSPISST